MASFDDLEKATSSNSGSASFSKAAAHDDDPGVPVSPVTRFTPSVPLARGLTLDRTFHRTNSISLTTGPARRNPGAVIPVVYRTLTLHISETRDGQPLPAGKVKRDVSDLGKLDWQTVTADEAASRLGVAPDVGLDAAQVQRRVTQYGKNEVRAPSRRVLGIVS